MNGADVGSENFLYQIQNNQGTDYEKSLTGDFNFRFEILLDVILAQRRREKLDNGEMENQRYKIGVTGGKSRLTWFKKDRSPRNVYDKADEFT